MKKKRNGKTNGKNERNVKSGNGKNGNWSYGNVAACNRLLTVCFYGLGTGERIITISP